MLNIPHIALDIESYYDDEYSLRKMSTIEYIRDPRFKIFGMSYSMVDAKGYTPIKWVSGEEFEHTIHTLPWADCAGVAHNAKFDFGALEFVYPDVVIPAYRICTESMACAVWGNSMKSRSLDGCAERLGLPPKRKSNLEALKGVYHPTLEQLRSLGNYCDHDLWLMLNVFYNLVGAIPDTEYEHIDWTIKNFSRPLLMLDTKCLEKLIEEVKIERQNAVDTSGCSVATLRSDAKFADVLASYGVSVPMKISARTSKPAYAFAKKDPEFISLQEHGDARVRNLVEARLAVKTSIHETRPYSYLPFWRRVIAQIISPVHLAIFWCRGVHTGHVKTPLLRVFTHDEK